MTLGQTTPPASGLGTPRGAAVAALFVVLTAILTYPLSLAPATRALPLSADTRLFLWTLGWDVHALATQPLAVFDANIFFPEPRTLAYSEHLIGSAVLGAPFLLAGGPLLALNAVLLLSCVLSGLGAFVLGRRLGLGVWGALVAGVVFAFGPPRFFRLAQLHVATVQWIPFALAALVGYLREGRKRDLWWAAALFTLQALTSGHAGLFLLLAALVLLGYEAALGRLAFGRLCRDAALPLLALLAANLPFLLPYFSVQREVGLHRTLGAVYDWAPDAASFLAAPTHAQQALLSAVPELAARVREARAYLFPGWLTLLLAGCGLWLRPARGGEQGHAGDDPAPPGQPPRGRRTGAVSLCLDALAVLAALAALAIHVAGGLDTRVAGITLRASGPGRAAGAAALLLLLRLALAPRAPFALAGPLRALRHALQRAEGRLGAGLAFCAALGLLSLWAALGPGWGLYTLLYRLLPGFDLIRVPSRLTVLTLLALGVLAGGGLEAALSRARQARRALLGVAALALLVLEFAAMPLHAPPYPLQVPQVDHWLAQQPRPFAAVELPVADPGDATRSARLHSHYMLHSMLHWQGIVNGYSGLVPPRHERLFRLLADFPEDAGLRELEQLGVRYAVLHRDFYSDTQWARALDRVERLPHRLALAHEAPDGRVYRLAPPTHPDYARSEPRTE